MFVPAIAKEMCLIRDNVADPVKFLSNIAVHLSGPSRTPGAVIVGSSGVRIFTPKPISTLLSSMGGTNVMLGLIPMATTAECLGKDSCLHSWREQCCFEGQDEEIGQFQGK